MQFRKIEHGSREYQRACALRQEYLRIPLGLNLYDEDLEAEKEQLHFGLFDTDGELVGCVSAILLKGQRAQIRQMVVTEGRQHQGLGQRIMREVEGEFLVRGVHELLLHARTTAIGFYEQLGYRSTGDIFYEVSIPHVTMVKTVEGRPPEPEPRLD